MLEPHRVYEAMIEDISIHGNVNLACREHHADYRNFIAWTRRSPERAQKYAHAKMTGLIAFADQTMEIADEDAKLVELKDSEGNVVDFKIDAGFEAWRKTRIETRKWHLAKLMPKQFGDNSALELSGQLDVGVLEQRIADGRKRLADAD